MNTPTFSIITVCYQALDTLPSTMDSLLHQTCNDFDYWIVDGGSTDGSLELIQQYIPSFEKKGIRLHLSSEADKGIYDAMNKGLKKAEGIYLCFLNAGDSLYADDTLEKIKQTLSGSNQPDFVYGETIIVDKNGDILGNRRLTAPKALHWKHFRMGMRVCHQAMFVKRSLAPSFDTKYRYSSDFDWSIRCLKSAKNILNTHLIHVRFLDGGVSKTRMKASLAERFAIMKQHYGLVPTALRHLWFVVRAAWFKLLHGWI